VRRALLAALAASVPAGIMAGLPPRYGGEIAVALATAPGEPDPARASLPAQLEAARALHATLVEVGPDGQLRPGLLAALPEAEPGGRAFRLRLRAGLHFHDGRPVTAGDVAASLARLATSRSHGWIALPLSGSEEVREGRAAAIAGVQVVGDLELRLALDAPFPELPRALAALPAAVLPRGGPPTTGAGPFRLSSRAPDGGLRLVPFDGFWRGRPYPDGLSLLATDARRAARAFGRGEVDLALRPEAVAGAASRDVPASTATYALVNGRRLGRLADDLRRALGSLDRSELARLAGGRAVPLSALLPPSTWQAPAAGPVHAPPRIGGNPRISLLAAEGNRALADRLQVKLFDRGVRAAVETVRAEALAGRLAEGAYDVALVSLTFTSSGPHPAILEAAWGLGGPAAARRALQRLGAADAATAAGEVAEELGVVPLLATGLRASWRPGLEGLEVLPDGTVDAGDLWSVSRPAR